MFLMPKSVNLSPFGKVSIKICDRYKEIEILQIRFPRHADAAGDEVVPLSSQVQFRKEFRVLVILAIGQHSFYDLALSLPFGIVQMFFIQPLEYIFTGMSDSIFVTRLRGILIIAVFLRRFGEIFFPLFSVEQAQLNGLVERAILILRVQLFQLRDFLFDFCAFLRAGFPGLRRDAYVMAAVIINFDCCCYQMEEHLQDFFDFEAYGRYMGDCAEEYSDGIIEILR